MKYEKPGRPPVAQSAKDAWRAVRKSTDIRRIAEAVSTSVAAVSKWKHVPEDRLETVAKLLDVPPEQLRPDLPTLWSVPSIHDYLKENT